MKHFFFTILLLIAWSSIYAQDLQQVAYTYKATYELQFKIDSTDSESIKSEPVLLYLSTNQSRYLSLSQQLKDSLFSTLDRKNRSMAEFSRVRSMIPKTEFNYVIFKSKPENKLVYAEKIFKDKFKYMEDLEMRDWQIKAETKEILSYTAQKAEIEFAGRNYTAWFTAEIPFSDGPYKFTGLPGLILEIYDDQDHYHFTLSGFQKFSKPVAPFLNLNTYKTIAKSDLLQIKENFDEDPISALEAAGVKLDFANSSLSKTQAKRDLSNSKSKKNNPIELITN
ncbi:GLPGLI family protein [Leeuwenhoekiella aestuarii]|uniref:GLPGLI family protein n=1 Tax=Leeuwenhoekiella aestuarii TaxID=2249426 RepID=A0A4Q0NNL1_9FLAO|nr:GLPGLI family protein [Leeuwenhoekiella aestuarii]RXG11517.1 GLPGLI family protein [Leeuwenhoekiella aestuarii]RXG12034.1 GLPGLI family protein [Leeuwenhoekiella aestuarii]